MSPLPRSIRRALPALAALLGVVAVSGPAAGQTASSTTTTTGSGGSTTTTSSTTSTSRPTTTTAGGQATSSTTAASTSDEYLKPIDISFPTEASAGFSDDYDAPRSGGRVHKATDLLGPKTLKLFAARAGTICFLTGFDTPPPGYGVMATVCGDDGREYNYIHINNDTPGTDDASGGPEYAFAPGLKRGSQVARGQWIATMGDSGNAEGTAPHLHFEIEDPSITDPHGTHNRNPYASLTAALARGDVPPQPQWSTDPVVRVAGADRVATSIALAARLASSPSVVIASGDRVADSLTAGPLAAAVDGPVLLNLGPVLDGRIVTEIRRLRPTRIVLVGGPVSLTPSVEATVREVAGTATVERLAGADRYATAAAVSQIVWSRSPRREAVVALGDHPDPARAWPDALTAGWLGALSLRPVLLTSPGGLPQDTAGALSGATGVRVVGGEAPIPAGVFAEVDRVAGTVTRIAGADRYATALKVVEVGVAEGASLTHIRVVTGRSAGDALAAGAAAADEKAVMLLIDGLEQRADMAVSYWLRPRSDRVSSAVVIGGPVVMKDSAVGRLARRIT
jgi:putative cell wall-binding protein